MKYSTKILSQTTTQLCLAKGINHVVISPGSRNAPLTIGFTGHSEFKNYSIVDERCAAFFALGLAQQLRKPVVLVCTSGSALLNYFPAVAEAFYSDIPLIILSADRPAHLVEVGDGQTIQQENVYGKHILYNANCIEGENYGVHNETEINIALNTAIELNGPVHINLPFSEPLYHTENSPSVQPQNVPARNVVPMVLAKETVSVLSDVWSNAGKKLILIGVMQPNSIEEAQLKLLAQDPSVLVFTETTSNLHHPNFIPAIDQLISSLDTNDLVGLQPDLLVTFGGMVVSKRIKAFLRKFQPKSHWHVDPKKAYDTFFCLDRHLKLAPNNFLKLLPEPSKVSKSTYRETWLAIRSRKLELHKHYLQQLPFSDLKVFSEIFKRIPDDIQLQLANSATIRYAQLFEQKPSVTVYCNRGTSGIDGSTSTAVGAAVASEKQTVLVTGDLSFFYDSNALWNAYIPSSFRIIIINNNGGGIFRILPDAKESKDFKTYFETSHTLSAKHLCAMYGLDYKRVTDEGSLEETLAGFFEISDTPSVLEILTPSDLNDRILLDYFNSIA